MQHTLVIMGDHRARTATRSLAVATVLTGWVPMALAALGRSGLRPARGTDVHVDCSGAHLVGRRQQSHPWAEVARVCIGGTGPRASMVTLEPLAGRAPVGQTVRMSGSTATRASASRPAARTGRAHVPARSEGGRRG